MSNNSCRFVIVIDVTASMGNWIDPALKMIKQMIHIASITNAFTEFAVLSYTDYDQKTPVEFSGWYNPSNYDSLLTFISKQYAHGGGDTPEAFKTAMYELLKHCDKSIKTFVLHLTDAPPHIVDRNDEIYKNGYLEKKFLGDKFNWCTMVKEIQSYDIMYSNITSISNPHYCYLASITNGSCHFVTNCTESILYNKMVSLINSWFGLSTDALEIMIGKFTQYDKECEITYVEIGSCLSDITIPYLANKINGIQSLFMKDKAYTEIVYNTFEKVVKSDLMVLCINKVFGRLWRCFLKAKTDERTITLERLAQLSYNALSTNDKEIFNKWNLESYDASEEINERISTFISENGICRILTHVPDLNNYKDARDVMDVFRRCNIVDQKHITDAFLRMSINNNVYHDPTPNVGECSNMTFLPENSIPYNLSNRDLFDLVLSIVSKGAQVNSERHRFILALLARKCGCVFKNRASEMLLTLKNSRETKIKENKYNWLTWDLDTSGNTIVGENYCISFLYLLKQNEDVLLPFEITEINQILQVCLAMRISNMELSVKLFDEKSMDGFYPNNTIPCKKCHKQIPDTIISGSGVCGYCCSDVQHDSRKKIITVRCGLCTRFYAREEHHKTYTSMRNKCYYCRNGLSEDKKISYYFGNILEYGNVQSTWICKCCNLAFVGSTPNEDYECGLCNSNKTSITKIVRKPTYTERNDNTLTKLLNNNMQPVYSVMGLETKLYNTEDCKVYKIRDKFTFVDVQKTVVPPLMFYHPSNETCIQIANHEEVWNMVLKAIDSEIIEKNYCEFCSTNLSGNLLMPICGRSKCSGRVCYDCGLNWYGDIKIGQLTNIRHLTCPMCDRRPTTDTICRWNRDLINLCSTIVYDNKKYYAWCITCSNIVEHSLKTCNNTTPTVTDYECGDCRFKKINLEQLDNASKAEDLFGKSVSCPHCELTIHKSEGCHHIKCPCGGHFCFKCGKGFESSSDTYAHMTAVHVTWFDNDDRHYYNDGYNSD